MSIPVFSVHGLIAWLEMQDPATTYSYTNAFDCLITRYLKAQGVTTNGCSVDDLMKWGFHNIANGGVDNYGAALARAKELAAP